MTPEQKRQIKVLRGCTFMPASWSKMFVRNMAQILDTEPEHALTEKQAQALSDVCHSYRKQHKACRCEECLRVGEHNPFQIALFEVEA